MKTSRNKILITNLVFLLSIFLLFLNDHFFKFQFSNLLTGKLSDICGIIAFPLLLTYIFPKLKEHSIYLTAFIFAFWKSEYSQSLIDIYNQISPLETSRVIDYTDLLVLVFLPIPYYLIKNSEKLTSLSFKKLNEKLILIPIFLILIAESPPIDFYYTYSNGNLKCYRCTSNVKYNPNDFIKKLENNGFVFDSIQPMYIRGVVDSSSYSCFKKELIIDTDTLRNIDFALRPSGKNKTKVYFNGMTVSQDLTDEQLAKKLRKYYRKLIFREIKSKL